MKNPTIRSGTTRPLRFQADKIIGGVPRVALGRLATPPELVAVNLEKSYKAGARL
jgi:hypothetical protein